jgi:hypothetical protein
MVKATLMNNDQKKKTYRRGKITELDRAMLERLSGELRSGQARKRPPFALRQVRALSDRRLGASQPNLVRRCEQGAVAPAA